MCLPTLAPQTEGEASFLQQAGIARSLAARGHTVDMVAPAGDLSNVVVKPALGDITPVERTWSRSALFRGARSVTWRLQRLLGIPYLNVFSNLSHLDGCLRCLPGHDIVHERNGLYQAAVAMACKRLKLPYLLFFDSDEIWEQDLFGRPLAGVLRWRARQIVRFTLKAADGVICMSSLAKARLIEHWNVPGKKISVFPNAVDVSLFRPYPELRAEVRAGLGIGDGPVIVFVSGFLPWHDVDSLLEAFCLVLREFSRARLVLVGRGNAYESAVRRTRSLGLEDAVHFAGVQPQSQVARLVAAADVAVSPFRDMALIGSPMKLFEYMAAGTPVVATSIGQIPSVIQDNVNGLLAPPEDAPALASRILLLLKSPSLRSRLAGRALQDARDRYSLERYAARLERVYQALIKRDTIQDL